MTGGHAADLFFFDTTLGPTNVDHITDFTPGLDKLVLSQFEFAGIGNPG